MRGLLAACMWRATRSPQGLRGIPHAACLEFYERSNTAPCRLRPNLRANSEHKHFRVFCFLQHKLHNSRKIARARRDATADRKRTTDSNRSRALYVESQQRTLFVLYNDHLHFRLLLPLICCDRRRCLPCLLLEFTEQRKSNRLLWQCSIFSPASSAIKQYGIPSTLCSTSPKDQHYNSHWQEHFS